MLTTKEVAHILRVHPNTVRKWSDEGWINVYRIGPRRDRRFKKKDVIAFLNSAPNSSGQRT